MFVCYKLPSHITALNAHGVSINALNPTEDFTGRVTLILANNFVTKCRAHYGIATPVFNPYIFFNPHAMLINAYTKEFYEFGDF